MELIRLRGLQHLGDLKCLEPGAARVTGATCRPRNIPQIAKSGDLAMSVTQPTEDGQAALDAGLRLSMLREREFDFSDGPQRVGLEVTVAHLSGEGQALLKALHRYAIVDEPAVRR